MLYKNLDSKSDKLGTIDLLNPDVRYAAKRDSEIEFKKLGIQFDSEPEDTISRCILEISINYQIPFLPYTKEILY